MLVALLPEFTCVAGKESIPPTEVSVGAAITWGWKSDETVQE